MTSKSQRNEEVVHEREHEIQKDTTNECDKSRVRYSSSNRPVRGKVHNEDGDGFNTNQLDEKITGVKARLSTLIR